MSWNGFPNYISKENETEIFFRLPYAGSKCEQLVKHCLKKMRRCLKINVKFVVTYNTNIISFYCNVKDKVSHEQRNNIICRIRCPGCGRKYIRKTERCLISRLNEHGKRDTEPMLKYLSE